VIRRALFIILLLAAVPAFATLTFTISDPVEFSPPGGVPNPTCQNGSLSCVIFSGTITPDSGADTFLNDIQIVFTPGTAFLSGNSAFFQSAFGPPGFMASSDPPYTGTIFEIDVASNAPLGTYHGTATILGNNTSPSPPNAAVSNAVPFTVVVTPEPAAGSLALLGLTLLLLRRRTKMRYPG
jgi:MYXO-CTERM domain-containing protein